MEALRFLAVSAGGVVLDIALAYTIATGMGAPLWLAAMIGFLVAAVVNYAAHELWTFRGSTLSARRAVQYVAAASVALVARLAVVAWLSGWIGRDYALTILLCGAAVSFCVNFTISKAVVFAKAPAPENRSR